MATKTKPARSAPLLHVGASQSAVKEARAAINDILRAPHVDNQTRVEALRALSSLCSTSNTTIHGCTFEG